ncbi:hypothetical protein LUX12_21940 [Streptomyces somaliensis]|uniref:hypothetical protein n=2 Tax=Streptomyces somaliensis TaxID=78355 RepID=UPI0020CE07A1|nr:hypothetical protein [Streptomyces somaliensis]MCP9946864.1 hypothetical protein [Streptomyces somaliensis]MCP9963503.1 hypothetical protein [Streptomyces somaliensis]
MSMVDKMIRLSLMSFPRPLNVTQFYPALSTYSVERPFSLGDFREAVDCFLDGNPLFPKCHLIERQFESPEEFPVSSFQGIVLDEYPHYYDGFLLMSVTYKSDPNVQGIFTAFPMSMQDGYRCFRFHQALMGTMKAGKDRFRIAEAMAELQLQTADLDQYLPARKPSIDEHEAVRIMPWELRETVEPALKIGSYLDMVKAEFLKRSSENLLVMKNASYASGLLFGNHLMFLFVPREVVARSSGVQIRDHYRALAAEAEKTVAQLETPEDFAKAGEAVLPGIAARPRRFGVNNYGDVSRYDGSDFRPESGTLVKYQWHMPYIVSRGAAMEGSGMHMTITLNGKAFHFLTERR